MNTFLDDVPRARFLGHPIHVMLIHFPAGLLPAGFLFDVLALVLHEPSFAAAAFYSYAAGVAAGLAAAVFGAMDYFRIPSEHQAWKTASIHALLNITWIFTFAYVCGTRLTQYPHFQIASTLQLVAPAICVVGMAVSNHLGGDLILRHGIGTVQRP